MVFFLEVVETIFEPSSLRGMHSLFFSALFIYDVYILEPMDFHEIIFVAKLIDFHIKISVLCQMENLESQKEESHRKPSFSGSPFKSPIEILYHKNPTQFDYYPQNFIRVSKLNTFCVFSPRGTFWKRF